MESWGYNPHEWFFLLINETTESYYIFQWHEVAFTRQRICQRLDLGLPSFQNQKKSVTMVYKSACLRHFPTALWIEWGKEGGSFRLHTERDAGDQDRTSEDAKLEMDGIRPKDLHKNWLGLIHGEKGSEGGEVRSLSHQSKNTRGVFFCLMNQLDLRRLHFPQGAWWLLTVLVGAPPPKHEKLWAVGSQAEYEKIVHFSLRKEVGCSFPPPVDDAN